MDQMWWKLIRIMFLLFALFATLPAEDIKQRITELFDLQPGKGVVIFDANSQHGPRPAPTEQLEQRPRRPISDNRPVPTPATPTTNSLPQQCADGTSRSRSFCTEVNDYPDLSGLGGELQRFANFFSDEQAPTSFETRMGNEEKGLCESVSRVVYPKMGQVADNSWRYIVNTDTYKQGVHIEECTSDNMKCDNLATFPNNYVATCKQHYVVRQVATFKNSSSGKYELDYAGVKLPSCCKCVVKYDIKGSP